MQHKIHPPPTAHSNQALLPVVQLVPDNGHESTNNVLRWVAVNRLIVAIVFLNYGNHRSDEPPLPKRTFAKRLDFFLVLAAFLASFFCLGPVNPVRIRFGGPLHWCRPNKLYRSEINLQRRHHHIQSRLLQTKSAKHMVSHTFHYIVFHQGKLLVCRRMVNTGVDR